MELIKTTNNELPRNLQTLPRGTRVLFANFPADGHFNPLTGIAVHLKNSGCDVRWYTSKKYEPKISRMDIPFYPLKKALDVSSHEDINEVFPERKNYKGQVSKLVFDIIHAFTLRAPEYYQDLVDIYKEFPFDVMVSDAAFTAIPFVREKMHIPVVSVSVFPLTETSKDLAPYGLAITPSTSIGGRWKQAALRFIADKILFAKPNKVMRHMLKEYDIDSGNFNVFDVLIQKSNLVLQSGTPSFEYKRSDLSPHIKFVGPLLPFTKKKDGGRWFHEKMKQYEKVILVTQGTVEKDIEKIIVPTLEAFKNTEVLVVVTTGGSQTEELRKRYRDNNIIIEDFIPFDDVMPYADVYVTNGGYGGVLLGIQHGLPMVVAGVHEGKNEINARIGYFKLGVNLKSEKPSAEQIKESVHEVLNHSTYNKNVERLKEEFNTYHPNELSTHYIAQVVRRTTIMRRPLAQVEKDSEIY
jgi:MGT family glycosyltransferase